MRPAPSRPSVACAPSLDLADAAAAAVATVRGLTTGYSTLRKRRGGWLAASRLAAADGPRLPAAVLVVAELDRLTRAARFLLAAVEGSNAAEVVFSTRHHVGRVARRLCLQPARRLIARAGEGSVYPSFAGVPPGARRSPKGASCVANPLSPLQACPPSWLRCY